MAEFGDDLQKQKIIVKNTPPEDRPKEHVCKSLKDGLQMEYTSSKLSPKENSGIEDVEEPSKSVNDASNTDLSMAHEDLKPYQDIDNSFESIKDFQTQKYDWNSCSSSLVADYDRFDEDTADTSDKSKQMSKISPSWEDKSTWIEIGRLPPSIVRTIVSVLREKLERSKDLEYDTIQHLLATKNTINDKLIRADNCNGLATSAKLKHTQHLSRFRDTFNMDELPTLGEVEECAEVAKKILNNAGKLMKNVKKLMDNAKNLMDDSVNLRDTDIGKKLAENSEKSMDKAKDMINYASKLIGIGEKLMQNSEKLSDIVVKWEENLNDWNEDLGNRYSFPTFLANFLLIGTLFAVLVVPALLAKYGPSDLVLPSVAWQSICGFNVSSPGSP